MQEKDRIYASALYQGFPAPSADDTNHSSKHSNDCYKKQSCINTGRTSHQYTRKHISSITVGSQYMFCTGWLLCHQKILYIRIIWTEFPGKSCCKKQDQCQYCKKDQFFSDMIFADFLLSDSNIFYLCYLYISAPSPPNLTRGSR